MSPLKSLRRFTQTGTAAIVCLLTALPLCADDAGKGSPTAIPPPKTAESAPIAMATPQAAPKPIEAAPATEPAKQPVLTDPLEQDFERETSKLEKMKAELKAVESLPLPSAAAPVVKAPVVKPAPNPNEIPKEPVKGLEEEYANSLYALGKYDLARAAYQRLIESNRQADVLTWARFQVANCHRRLGDLPAASAAYEALLNAAPASPWVTEAAWWAGETKWWILWGQSTK